MAGAALIVRLIYIRVEFSPRFSFSSMAGIVRVVWRDDLWIGFTYNLISFTFSLGMYSRFTYTVYQLITCDCVGGICVSVRGSAKKSVTDKYT